MSRTPLLGDDSVSVVGVAQESRMNINDTSRAVTVGFGSINHYNYTMRQFNTPIFPLVRNGIKTPMLKSFFGGSFTSDGVTNKLIGLFIRLGVLFFSGVLAIFVIGFANGDCMRFIESKIDSKGCDVQFIPMIVATSLIGVHFLLGLYIFVVLCYNAHVWKSGSFHDILNLNVGLTDLGDFGNRHLELTQESTTTVAALYGTGGKNGQEIGALAAKFSAKGITISIHLFRQKWQQANLIYPRAELRLTVLLAFANFGLWWYVYHDLAFDTLSLL
jgi:hypothetical protein